MCEVQSVAVLSLPSCVCRSGELTLFVIRCGVVARYLFGPRWHPGEAITDLAIHPETSTGADVLPAVVVAATDGGVVFLEQQIWTLAVSYVSLLVCARGVSSIELPLILVVVGLQIETRHRKKQPFLRQQCREPCAMD